MAGRNISVSHVALAPVRVMNMTAEMGTVLGRAAYIMRKHNVDPREMINEYLEEFKEILKNPQLYETKE